MAEQPHTVGPLIATGPLYNYFNNPSDTVTFFGHRKSQRSVHSTVFGYEFVTHDGLSRFDDLNV